MARRGSGVRSSTSTPRKFAIVAPDSVTMQPCLEILQRALDAAGVSARTVTYALDLGTIQSSGQQIASTLAEDGVTTVLLMTDPATPFFLSSGAQSIRWSPEWVVLGQYGLDADYLAQIFPREQWVHAFGFSYSGQYQPPRANAGYFAFKQQSPDTEPAILLLPAIYAELRMLAIGDPAGRAQPHPRDLRPGVALLPEHPRAGQPRPRGHLGLPGGGLQRAAGRAHRVVRRQRHLADQRPARRLPRQRAAVPTRRASLR